MGSFKLVCCLNPDAACTNRVLSAPFLPYLFRQGGKDRAAGGISQNQPAISSLVGKEETATEDKRRRLRRLVLSWPFLTRRRRHTRIENFRGVLFGACCFCLSAEGRLFLGTFRERRICCRVLDSLPTNPYDKPIILI